jgi:hypothetical protein
VFRLREDDAVGDALVLVTTIDLQPRFPNGVAFPLCLLHLALTSTGELLATDGACGSETVHVIDIEEEALVGHVAPPGGIPGKPQGLATWGSLVAVSSWTSSYAGEHAVRLYSGARQHWSLIRILGGMYTPRLSSSEILLHPGCLRFSADGTELVIGRCNDGCLDVFTVHGAFVRRLASGLGYVHDVEPWGGGWLVACDGTHRRVRFVDGSHKPPVDLCDAFTPRAISAIPGKACVRLFVTWLFVGDPW